MWAGIDCMKRIKCPNVVEMVDRWGSFRDGEFAM